MKSYMFKEVNSYDTPENHPVSIWFRIFRRWYFYWINFAVFITCGKLGKKGRLDKDAQIEQSNRNFKLVEDCGGKIHLRGLEHLRAVDGKPCVLVANHMSLLETAMIHSISREYVDFSFVVKKSLYDIPYFKHLIGSLDAIAVGRSNPRDDLKTVLTEGKRILQGARSLFFRNRPAATWSIPSTSTPSESNLPSRREFRFCRSLSRLTLPRSAKWCETWVRYVLSTRSGTSFSPPWRSRATDTSSTKR